MSRELAAELSTELRDVLEPLLNEIESLNERIQEYDERIEKIAKEVYPEVALLKQTRFKVGGGSYLSSHAPRVVLGLGKHERLDTLESNGPSPAGSSKRITDLPINRYITIVEGEDKWKYPAHTPRFCCSVPFLSGKSKS